jgi:hypothetical protein
MYIINPWFFYIISICDALKFTFIFTGAIIVIGLAFWIPIYFAIEEGINPIDVIKKSKWFLIVILLGAILVPSSTTCYKMLIASQVTTERVETAKETIQDVADYIIDAVTEIEEVKNND